MSLEEIFIKGDMVVKERKGDSRARREMRKSLSGRILRSAALNVLAVVVVSCIIMVLSMQSLANSILLDSLQPMARQSSKTVEANIHMLADRMMTIAGDSRITGEEGARLNAGELEQNRNEVLTEAAEIYELYTIALYDLDGRLIQGIGNAPGNLDSGFFGLLKETDNLTTHTSTIFQDKLGITMGMPVKENGQTSLYVVGVYKYDTLNDVISSINLGKNGMAYMVNQEGVITGHPDQSLALNKKTLYQIESGNEQALSHVTTGETGGTEFSEDGKQMLVAFSPIRGTQWYLVIQVPKSDYNHLINAAMAAAILCTMAVLAVSIMLVRRLAGSIAHPVTSVTGRMVALSDGDLHTEVVPVSSGDELEVLTRTLEATLGSVNRYISDIQQVLTQVAKGNLNVEPHVDYQGDFALIRASLGTIIHSMNETLSGFRAAAARLSGMAEELNGQSTQLHQASLEQNESTEELVSEVSHVKEQLASVTESSGQTRLKTEEITQRVEEANTQMTALSQAMDNISANAQEITQIAKAIEDIAFQTGLLSINASVEAARAGTAGKGFAVVANEVKQLASRSAQAAQSATDVVNKTRMIIQTGVELTADTAHSIDEISVVSTQISAISDKLVAAVQGQESALAIMEERIDAISSIADRNLQNAEGTRHSSGRLSEEAEGLQKQVKKFILREEQTR